jgi:hypothetical protein
MTCVFIEDISLTSQFVIEVAHFLEPELELASQTNAFGRELRNGGIDDARYYWTLGTLSQQETAVKAVKSKRRPGIPEGDSGSRPSSYCNLE